METKNPKNVVLRQILGGGATSLAVRTCGLLLGFVAQILLSRSLGDSAFGAYSIALSWCMLLAVVVKFGTDDTILKFASGYRSQGQFRKINAMILFTGRRLVMMLVVCSTALLLVSLLYPQLFGLDNLAQVGAMIMLTGALAGLGAFQVFFRSFEKIALSQVFEQVLRSLFMILMIGICLFLGWKLDFFAGLVIAAVAAALALLVALLAVHKVIWSVAGVASSRSITDESDWLVVSRKLFGAALLAAGLAQMMVILVGAFATNADAGHYSAAARLAALVNFGLVALNSITGPMIAAAFNNGDNVRLEQIASHSARVAAFVSLAPVAVLVIWGQEILMLFGTGFQNGYPSLLLLAISTMVAATFGPVGYFLSMTNEQSAYFMTLLVAVIVSFVLALVFIPIWGAVGGAAAALVGRIVQYTYSWYLVRTRLGIDTSVIGIHRAHEGSRDPMS